MTCKQQLRNEWSLPAQFILHELYHLERVVPHHLTKISITILYTLLSSQFWSTYGVGITIEPINKVHVQKEYKLKISNLQTYPKLGAQMGASDSERAWSQTVGGLLTTVTAGNCLQHPTQQFH